MTVFILYKNASVFILNTVFYPGNLFENKKKATKIKEKPICVMK